MPVLIFTKQTERKWNQCFAKICNWFAGMLSISIGKDETKSILLTPKHEVHKVLKQKTT